MRSDQAFIMAQINTSLGSRLYEDFAWARIFSAFCPVSFLISLSDKDPLREKGFIQYRIVSVKPEQCFGSVFP